MPEPVIYDLHPESVLAAVAVRTGVAPDEIRGPRRFQRTLHARALAMRVLRDAGWSLPEIGRFFDRDHSSVLSLLRRYDVPAVRAQAESVRKEVDLAAANCKTDADG